jgi:hypothetical protein
MDKDMHNTRRKTMRRTKYSYYLVHVSISHIFSQNCCYDNTEEIRIYDVSYVVLFP